MRDEPRTAEAPAGTPAGVVRGPLASGPDEQVVASARAASRLGRYQLLFPLAQGGMGVVFAARLRGSHGLERLVAIKTLRPVTSRSDRAALLREAKLTARLHHRNVVATIDLGEVDDVPYVVMELVDGVPFSHLLGAVRLAPEVSAWIVMQAALGLHAAHELTDESGRTLGLVHRDISPQNILVSLGGEVKIADFGIAKFAGREESTETGMIRGKFAYMSPEQASAVELDRRSDIFALGVVLWEALTGRRLFASETPARTIMRVMKSEIQPPRALRPDVDEGVSRIAMHCLARDPAARPPTAAAVAEALRAALRARGAQVDEGDVGRVVTARFGAERAAFMGRLRDAALHDTTTVKEPFAGEVSGLAAVSVSPLPIGRRSRPVLALAVGLAVGVLGFFAWRVAASSATRSPRPVPEAPAASLAAPSAEPGIVASPALAAAPLPPPTNATPAGSEAPVSLNGAGKRPPPAVPPKYHVKPGSAATGATSAKPAAPPGASPFDSL